MSGKVKGGEYDAECKLLIHQFTMQSADVMAFNLDNFVKEYNLIHCQSAIRRIKDGKTSYKGEDIDRNVA